MLLKWTKAARNDYRKVIKYLSDSWTESEVLAFVDKVIAMESLLIANPLAGREEFSLSHLSNMYRSFPIDKINRLVYWIDEDIIVIARIWDMRRNPEALVKLIK